MDSAPVVFILIPLAWAAYTDFRRRIIPNIACAAVFIAGVAGIFVIKAGASFYAPLWMRLAGLAPALVMLILAELGGGVGGGDIKLGGALGFAVGFMAFALVFSVAALSAFVWAKIKKERSAPLGSFLFIGYLAYLVVTLIINSM